MPLKYLMLVLRSRLPLVLFVLVVTIAAGTVFTLMQPKQYTGVASLLINFGSQNPFEDTRLPPQLAASYMATQVDIITSRNVLLRVVDQLGVADVPEERAAWAEVLLKNVKVETSRDSRVVTIRYRGADPEWVARVANGFAAAYAATAQQLAVEPAKRNTVYFDNQLEKMRKRLEAAQSRLTTVQREKGIVALDEKLDTETTRLNELTNQLVEAQAEMYDVRSRQLGVNHPDYRRAIARESSIRESVAEQKERLLSLKQQRDELGVLAREVNVEQEAYEHALQVYYSEQLQSSLAQTSVEILDEAVPPSAPSSPNVMLNFIGSVLLGTMLAALTAFGAELLFRKIRASEDVVELLESKVLTNV